MRTRARANGSLIPAGNGVLGVRRAGEPDNIAPVRSALADAAAPE